MKNKILIINICKEKLHYFEFVKPIEDILKNSNQKTKNIKFFTKHYTKLNSLDVDKADRIIICGTSLKDNDFAKDENIATFNWIKPHAKPILGICGGLHFISYTKSKIPQAIKHETGEIYGVLFHPEVRNKELILYFVKQ